MLFGTLDDKLAPIDFAKSKQRAYGFELALFAILISCLPKKKENLNPRSTEDDEYWALQQVGPAGEDILISRMVGMPSRRLSSCAHATSVNMSRARAWAQSSTTPILSSIDRLGDSHAGTSARPPRPHRVRHSLCKRKLFQSS